MENSEEIFKALEDDDFVSFSKSIKAELDRKVKDHPMTINHQSEFEKYQGIEALYAKAKEEMSPKEQKTEE